MAGLPEKDADPVWSQVRRAVQRENAGFRDARRIAVRGRALTDLPVVGTAYGRSWEVRFHRPRFLYPDRILGLTTGIRWTDPATMRRSMIPWLYIGARPRAFSRANLELDRIMMRYKRTEGDLRGLSTGDAPFDKKWAVYASHPEIGEVMREAIFRKWLADLAELRPRRGDDLPTIASLGGTAVLSLVIDSSTRSVQTAANLPRTFGGFLDKIETTVGQVPAGSRPLTMDLMPDELGYPVPVLRFTCPLCGQQTHPRHQPNVDTDVCDQCGKSLYRLI
jgi:hypothetical protein